MSQFSFSDPSEIEKFNTLAAQWWDPNGPMKPLHRINPLRVGLLKRECAAQFQRDEHAMRPFERLKLLDIGCAAGLITEPMARMGFDVTGIDLAERNIAIAKQHAEQSGLTIRYESTPLENLPDEPTYDVITLLEVVEHVPDVGAMVAEAAKRLKPGGILLGSTLNRTLKAYALAIVGAEYVLRWLPKGTHEWNKFVTPDEFAAHMEAAGLEPGERIGMTFNPLLNRWSLNADTDVNYLIVARKAG